MLEIIIPGGPALALDTLVLDFNGTVAVDGQLIDGVDKRLRALSQTLHIHVVTADTHGNAADRCAALPVHLEILGGSNQDEAKRDFVMACGARSTVAVGNGRNDLLMLGEAALSIAIIGPEGAYGGLFGAADIVCRDINDGLDLLLEPARLIATLRNW
jgi:soluble P-type ATPase